MEIPFKYSDECKVKNVVNSNQSVSEILEDLDRMTTMDDASFFNSVM